MKSALILHGWPRPESEDGLFYKNFKKWGYEVIQPDIFSPAFVLTVDNAKKFISDELKGRAPDVIVGISMGGLLAPHIIKNYPNAKMIMVATAPRLKPKAKGFKLLIDLAKNKKLLNSLEIVKVLPKKFLFRFYEAINPFKGDLEERLVYMEDMKNNFKYILGMPISKEGEIVDFVTGIDNTKLLKNIKNKTLIFSGENDLLMPQNLGNELINLLPNSRLVISHGSHFDVIGEPSFVEMKKFLSE